MNRSALKLLTGMGLLVAMEIILSRFCSINAWNIKIGFNFLPVAVAAILFGGAAAGAVAALGDFFGAILFPIGAYFPGFTATAFFTGMVMGLFLHRRQTAPRILGAVLIKQLLLSLLVNSLWISVLYGSPYVPVVISRIPQTLLLGPVEFFTIGFAARALRGWGRRAVA